MAKQIDSKGIEWLEGRDHVFGFNYVTSTAVNSTEMFREETFDLPTITREFSMASEIGYNSCRVFLPFIVWANDAEGFIKRFGDFLSAADANNISVMPILFDDCSFSGREPYWGDQDPPVKGVHNSGWTASPGYAVADDPDSAAMLEAYVKTLVSSHWDDRRIIAWDMYNEPGNHGRGRKSLPLLEKAFAWSRECNPVQPLTAGVWSPAEYEECFCRMSDVISFHEYGDLEAARNTIHRMKQYGLPMFCTEWMHRRLGSRFETHLPMWLEEGVGIYQWGLVAGKTQTYLSWDISENDPSGFPGVWQHDLLTPAGKPYDPNEIKFIKMCLENDSADTLS